MSFKTSNTSNKEVVRNYIEKVVNTGDTSTIGEYISDHYTEIFNNVAHEMGIEGAVRHVAGVRETYPDIELTIDRQFSEGDYVITCYTMRGTHLGEWMGIKPTGRRIEVTGVNVDRVKQGRIVEHGGAANLLHPLLEAGAVKVAGP